MSYPRPPANEPRRRPGWPSSGYMPPQNPRPRPGQFRQPPQPQRSAPPPRAPQNRWPPPPPARRRRRRGGTVKRVLLVVLVLLAALVVYVDTTLAHIDALPDYPEHVANTPGTNWLIVGSDSREGLTPEQQEELATGAVEGRRTDTIMLLHIPGLAAEGQPTLVSLPRDSSVPLPDGEERVKLNAAYAIGGPPLLAQTVETVTGVHLDHYAEIGFGGFAGIVDDIGGVELCLPEPISDPLAGIDLPAGCQELSGPQALGYVRTRASANGDLDRVMRQREFFGALVSKATSPAVLLNPFRAVPLATGVPDALTVDNGDHIWHLARLGWAMRGISSGGVLTTTVPIAGFGEVGDGGSAVLWDREAAGVMFDALANDEPVPPEVLPG